MRLPFSYRASSLFPPGRPHSFGVQFSPLPHDAIAPKVKGWPTPWISQSQYSANLSPLFERGWFAISRPFASSNACAKESRLLHVPLLVGSFRFSSFSDSARFLNDILWLSESEKHHPDLSLKVLPGEFMVQIVSQTHSAKPPSWNSEKDSTVLPGSIPGITARDARMAGRLTNSYCRYATTEEDNHAEPSTALVPEWKGYDTWLQSLMVPS